MSSHICGNGRRTRRKARKKGNGRTRESAPSKGGLDSMRREFDFSVQAMPRMDSPQPIRRNLARIPNEKPKQQNHTEPIMKFSTVTLPSRRGSGSRINQPSITFHKPPTAKSANIRIVVTEPIMRTAEWKVGSRVSVSLSDCGKFLQIASNDSGFKLCSTNKSPVGSVSHCSVAPRLSSFGSDASLRLNSYMQCIGVNNAACFTVASVHVHHLGIDRVVICIESVIKAKQAEMVTPSS